MWIAELSRRPTDNWMRNYRAVVYALARQLEMPSLEATRVMHARLPDRDLKLMLLGGLYEMVRFCRLRI